jgi:GNAT superfamily N-acetyltransferase
MSEPTCSIISFKGSELPIAYQALIFSGWLRSLRKGNDLFKVTDSNAYYANYHKYVENLLQKPGSLVKLAVLSDNHDIALGFSVSREDVLDYIFVQPEQRGQKISTLLIPEGITTFTHMTKVWLPIWQYKYREWKFNPFA